MKKLMVISLGGSLIIPKGIDIKFLEGFKQIIRKHEKNYKFVIVCGGGSIARGYIDALKSTGKSRYLQSMAGISATRMNARFMAYLFGKDADEGVPHNMQQVKNLLNKNRIVFCGALRYAAKETSDATAAKLANFLQTKFINLTDVPGMYSKDPKKYKDAKFISSISWQDFSQIAKKIVYRPGQHFILDQNAAEIIHKNKIVTYILGRDLNSLDAILAGKSFKGTIISG